MDQSNFESGWNKAYVYIRVEEERLVVGKSGKILILYYHDLGYPMRKTNEEMLYCFQDFSEHLCYYINCAFDIPIYLEQIKFDLIIFHDLLLCKRSLPRRIYSFIEKSFTLLKLEGLRIALVQDEFTQTKLLNEVLEHFQIKHIFSTAKQTEWHKIYPTMIQKSKFSRFLTGYINESSVEQTKKLLNKQRKIDIGYRANSSKRYSLGSQGLLKSQIAEEFIKNSPKFNLNTDISLDNRKAFLGFEWYEFLADCKYTLGVESGASILDEDGSLEVAVANYLDDFPDANYQEVENKFFLGRDGELELFTVGPRHLEACMTKTCQILVEGDYNGILKPWVHYIPIKNDFSDIEEVLKIIREDKLRAEIVNRTYNDIVESNQYSYRRFVNRVFEESLGNDYEWSCISENEYEYYLKNQKRENLIWKYIPIRSWIVNKTLNAMPKKVFRAIEHFMKTTKK